MKKFLCLVLCLILGLSLVACGDDAVFETDTENATEGLFEVDSESTEGNTDLLPDSSSDPNTDSADSSDPDTDSADSSENKTDTDTNEKITATVGGDAEPLPVDKYPNQVMACDQQTGRILVYDLDLIEPGDDLDDAIIWSYNHGYAAGLKFREDTVFGDVVIIAGRTSSIVSYPEGKVLWSTTNPGNNPHSIEILPSGNIVIANSTGCTVRFFYASAILEGNKNQSQKFFEKELYGAHGVLWDPEYDVLWALGDDELIAFSANGEGMEQTITQISGMGAKFPKGKDGGHDLAADLTDTRYLYLSGGKNVFRFDKEENVMIERFPNYAKLTHTDVKGYGNNLNGNFFFCYPNHGPGTAWENDGKADWCTDEIWFVYRKTANMMYAQKYVSSTAAFYKCRTFYGQYQ